MRDEMNHYAGPRRIVCLTAETAETLYLLGEDERIVGISGFTRRPKEAPQKPKISAFTSAKIDRILELEPDLAIGFSRLQAQIAHDLTKAGVNVLTEGVRQIHAILARAVNCPPLDGLEPAEIMDPEFVR
jgi:iron complex transport system substrate-binding protein